MSTSGRLMYLSVYDDNKVIFIPSPLSSTLVTSPTLPSVWEASIPSSFYTSSFSPLWAFAHFIFSGSSETRWPANFFLFQEFNLRKQTTTCFVFGTRCSTPSSSLRSTTSSSRLHHCVLTLDGASIGLRSHTNPSHSQTFRLFSSSLSLGIPFPRSRFIC